MRHRLLALSMLLTLSAPAAAMARRPAEPPCSPPAPGAIAFGLAPGAVRAALGQPRYTDHREGWLVTSHQACGAELTLRFWRERLGRVRVSFNAPVERSEAAAWGRALLPGASEQAMARGVAAGSLLMPLTIDKLPFEAELSFVARAGGIEAITGQIGWLD